MFEHSLIDLEEKKRPRRRRWISLPIAIGFHLAILASVLLAQAWSVSEVPEPDVNVVFFAEASPPPPPAAAPARSSAPTKPVQTAQTPTVKAPVVQPEETPDTTPEPVSSPVVADLAPTSTDSGPGVPWGVDGGDGDGDGDTIGGDREGVPHSVGEPEPQVDPNLPIRVIGAVKRPEFLAGPQPRYTETARKAGVQGVVILEAIIDEQGRVTNLKVLKGLPMGLDQSAVEAVSQWRYKPATLEKRAVKVIFTLTVNFQLQR